MLCKALFFLMSVTHFLMGCDEELPSRQKLNIQSFKVRLEFAQFQYQHLPEQLKTGAASTRYDHLVAFYNESLKPLLAEAKKAGIYKASLTTLQTHILADLCEAQFLCVAEKKIDSRDSFAELYKRFDYLSPTQKKKYRKKWQPIWDHSLRYGTAEQVTALSCYGEFKPEQADSVYARLQAEPIDTQLECVGTMLKNSKSFLRYVTLPRSLQGSIGLPLVLSAHVVRKKVHQAFNLFKLDDGTLGDQLFMRTMVPFVFTQKKNSQKVVAQLLELWARDECTDIPEHSHGRCEKIFEYVSSNVAFKKAFESTKSACPLFWCAQLHCAQLHIVLWNIRDEKALSHEKFKQEQLTLLKKAEEYFAKISVASAKVLTVKDDIERLSGHGAILNGLLHADTKISKSKAYELCERALKSGVNIADTKCLAGIAKHIKGEEFLKLVEPYRVHNVELTHSVASLYDDGCKTADHKYWWIAPHLAKSEDWYTKNFKMHQHIESFVGLLCLYKNLNKLECIETLCTQAEMLFPENYPLKVQQAFFLRGRASQLSSGEEKNRYLAKVADLMRSLVGKEAFFSAADFVCYYALQASLAAVAYCTQEKENPATCKQAELEHIASLTEKAYHSSLGERSLDTVTVLFDPAVCQSLKVYAKKMIEKSREERTYKDLKMLALCGYTFYATLGENSMSEDDRQFVDDIIACGLEGDTQKQIPPLMHVLFVKYLLKNGVKNCQKLILSHLVPALQGDTADADVDAVARYIAENYVSTLANGFMNAQMVLAMYYKESMHAIMPLLLKLTKQIGCIHKEDIPAQIEWINSCGVYALLKEKLLKGSCRHCQSDSATILLRWLRAGLLFNGDKSDPQLAPFFEDIKLITPYVKG